MFNYSLKCKDCGEPISLDRTLTIKDYVNYSGVTFENVEDLPDKIINDALIYKCVSCGQTYKYTFKELEKQIREAIKIDACVWVFRNELDVLVSFKHKFFVFCGKCPGFDGTGCCPKEVFESCSIKRFPLDEL